MIVRPVMIKQQINKLLDAEMDRRDFMKNAGLAVLAVTGVTTVLKSFTQIGSNTPAAKTAATAQANSYGYGSSPYGGNR